jgi:hypothetical protein
VVDFDKGKVAESSPFQTQSLATGAGTQFQ